MKLVIIMPRRMAVTAFSSACPFISGRITSMPAGKLRLQPLLQFIHRNSRRIHQIDAIEVMAAIEDHLRGVDIHDRDIAAEHLANAGGLEDPFNREVLLSRAR